MIGKVLAAAAVSPVGFPDKAVTVVMAALAGKRPDLFGAEHESSLPYRYAADVVRAGMTAAMEDVGYYRALEPRLQFEMAQALGEVRETLGRVSDTTEVIEGRTSEILRRFDEFGGQKQRDDFIPALEDRLVAAEADRARERDPLHWAMTQMNLGNALSVLGERERGTVRLEEAVTAYRLALEERTRARVPLQWATTQENMALAEKALADKDAAQRAAHLQAALDHVDRALEIYNIDELQYQFERATRLRERILAAM